MDYPTSIQSAGFVIMGIPRDDGTVVVLTGTRITDAVLDKVVREATEDDLIPGLEYPPSVMHHTLSMKIGNLSLAGGTDPDDALSRILCADRSAVTKAGLSVIALLLKDAARETS